MHERPKLIDVPIPRQPSVADHAVASSNPRLSDEGRDLLARLVASDGSDGARVWSRLPNAGTELIAHGLIEVTQQGTGSASVLLAKPTPTGVRSTMLAARAGLLGAGLRCTLAERLHEGEGNE